MTADLRGPALSRQGDTGPLTVCHLIASNFAGGPEKQILELSERLRRAGWSVVIASFRENRDSVEIVERARRAGFETFLVDTRTPFSPAAVSQLKGCLREHAVDVMISHGYKANVVGWLANRSGPIRQIPTVRGFTGEDWKIRLYETVDRWVLRRFPRLISVSGATREMLIREGVAPERIEVVHNAVDCTRPVGSVDLHGEFDLPEGARVLVAAGRLSPEKGHRVLVEAMQGLADELPDLVALILGSGRLEKELQNEIESRGLRGRVVLGGFRRDVPACLAAADLVVNPSHTEGLPNVVLEAMAAGTAVVATAVGGVAELVVDGHTGWLVPAGDPSALASAIREAVSDPVRLADAGRVGAERVREAFSFERQAERFMALCRG